jgi:hypothetical protein
VSGGEVERMKIRCIDGEFSILKLNDLDDVSLEVPFSFVSRTDEELSVVCPSGLAPKKVIVRDDGWILYGIAGKMDFSLIGVIAKISEILRDAEISVFVISTFDTDYFLIKKGRKESAESALREAGYDICGI